MRGVFRTYRRADQPSLEQRMKALVIGGSGPTGPHVLDGLIERGYDVTMLHRGLHESAETPVVRHIHADPHFSTTLIEALQGETFDVVVAAYGRLKVIAEAMAGKCGHLVAVSGIVLYRGFLAPEASVPFGMKLLADEDSAKADETDEPSRFANMVLDAERAVFAAAAAGGYQASTVRFPQIYGPRNVVPWEWAVVKRILDGRSTMILPDDGLWVISRCAARNAAEVILRIVDNPVVANGQAYNCGDDDQYTVRQWAELVAHAAGGALEFVGIPSSLARSALAELKPPHSVPHMLVSTEKARHELGYQDVTTARDALRATVHWLLANPVTNDAYPSYAASFDYAMEDKLINSYGLAAAQVRASAPDSAPRSVHPMPHPKTPSLIADERGR
jgi:nucleoside-diphosphate-sugar epimerase